MPRKVIIRPRAEKAIQAVALFIESKNTPGSGAKWVNQILDFLLLRSAIVSSYPLCRNIHLSQRNFSCIIFNKKWVIVFKQTKRTFDVHQVIYGPNLI